MTRRREGTINESTKNSFVEEKASLRAGVLMHIKKYRHRKKKQAVHLSKADVFAWLKSLICCIDMEMEDEGDRKLDFTKKFLSGVEAFTTLKDQELSHLARLTELRTYTNGQIICENEANSDGLFVVLSGSAERQYLMDNDPTDTISPEIIEYQDIFGVPVAPVPLEFELHESRVLTVSPSIECLWIPLLVIRMMNIQPRMEYEFVVILKNSGGNSEREYRQQEEVVSNILNSGIHVTVLANTRNTAKLIILLLSAPLWLLAREDKLMKMERIVEYHSDEDARALGEEYCAHADAMTAADRLQAFASILTRNSNDKPPGAGLLGIENNQDCIIHDVFPLHDPSVSDFIVSSWFKEAISASTRRLFLLRTKDHFGLRIAFYTAFVRLYTASLVYPVIFGCVFWFFIRWINYSVYVPMLGIYGLVVAFAWAPSVLKRWKRYQNALLVEWDLLQAKEVEYPNPEFRDYVVETLNVATEGDVPDFIDVKVYDSRRRWPKYVIYGIFCVVCLSLLFVFVSVYVQWYIIAVMTPMCIDPRCPTYFDSGNCITHCNELVTARQSYQFLHPVVSGELSCSDYCDNSTFDIRYYACDQALVGCFETERGILGTSRWFYVLVQGIVLGLTLDIAFLAVFELIASAFNKWENYATIQENERRYVEKIFLFNWVGYFYWFFVLAFLYVPYGEDVQNWIREFVDTSAVLTLDFSFKYSRYWVKGLIAMDSAFVTPLIVTQALNMLINTFVPYLLRRALLRARSKYLVGKDQLSARALKVSAAAHAAVRQGRKVYHIYRKGEKRAIASMSKLGKSLSESVDIVLNREQSSIGVTLDIEELPEDEAESLDAQDLEVQAFDNDEDRAAYALMLSERTPIRSADLEATLDGLINQMTSHESRMSMICSNLKRSELDQYQVRSYDWIERVTIDIEKRNRHKGIWEDFDVGHVQLKLIKNWHCRNYIYTADRIKEESSMPVYNTFGDLLRMAIQFSYVVMFSVVWPFCALCAYCNNSVALRFDAIKMTIDCKRPVPRRTVGIGAWTGAFMFETLIAVTIVPGLFVHVSGQLDSFRSSCAISEEFYGPVEKCFTPAQRLISFCALENIGILICFLVYLKKSDITTETSIKMQQHGRKMKHSLRKSVRTIGETILVQSDAGEWREGTVSWVRNGNLKVSFGGIASTYINGNERWLENEIFAIKAPVPVKIFEVGMSALMASIKAGRWLSCRVTKLDTRDHCGNELEFKPNELHIQIKEARNLRSAMIRGVVDPYCVILCGSQKYSTSIKRHTMNPVWDEALHFPLLESESRVRVLVYNHDSLSLGECVGEVDIELNQFKNGKAKQQWYQLVQRKHVLSMEGIGNAMHKFGLGAIQSEAEILIELQWIDTRFPTRIHVEFEAPDSTGVKKVKVLSRRFCEKRLCYGIEQDELHRGRLFQSDASLLL